MVFAFGKIEAFIATFTHLLLFFLFLGAFLKKVKKIELNVSGHRSSVSEQMKQGESLKSVLPLSVFLNCVDPLYKTD